MSKTKCYVLRTHSLLIPRATLQFDADNVVAIPMAVLEDLEHYEGYPEDKKAARQILKYIESLGVKKLTTEGVRQSNGSLIRIIPDAENEKVEVNNIRDIDKRCFQACLKLKKEGQRVILISNSETIRIKAQLIGIEAEEPRFILFPELKNQYKGKMDVYTSETVLDTLQNGAKVGVEDIEGYDKLEWAPNMYLTIKSYDGRSCLANYDGHCIKQLRNIKLPPGFKVKNNTQRFLVDAVNESFETAPVVIVKGPAGTGKTYCSLVMAMFHTYGIGKGCENDHEMYGRTLIAAPMVDDIAKKIGAVPGSIEQKMNPYAAGILDNVNDILNYNKYFKINISEELGYKDPVRYLVDETHKIKLVSLDLLRGRTFPNVCFIIDEAQNIKPSDMKTIATRIGEGSKFVFLGDPSQVDSPSLNERYNGLTYLAEVFKGNELCRHITFDRENETVRSKFARVAATML